MRDLFFERRMALVVGNADYASAVGQLYNPVNDATRVAEALETCGFTVELLLDASRETLASAQKDFVAAADGADVSVFYYSGHGFQVAGENYLVPVDFDPSSPGDASGKAVNLTSFLTEASQSSGTCIAFLDACRNNPNIVRSLQEVPGPKRDRRMEIVKSGENDGSAVAPGLAKFDVPAGDKNTFVAFATAPGNVADDGTGDHSPFTIALLSQLGIPGLSLDSLMQRVTTAVRASTKSEQVPWATSTVERPFYFRTFDARPFWYFAAISLLLLPPLAAILALSLGRVESLPSVPTVLGTAIGLMAMMGLYVFKVRQGFALTFALVVSGAVLAGLAAEHVQNLKNPETYLATELHKIDLQLVGEIASCEGCSDSRKDELKLEVENRKDALTSKVRSSEAAVKAIAAVTGDHALLAFLPLAVVFLLSFQIAALQRMWLQFMSLAMGLLLATAEPKLIAPASSWVGVKLLAAHTAIMSATEIGGPATEAQPPQPPVPEETPSIAEDTAPPASESATTAETPSTTDETASSTAETPDTTAETPATAAAEEPAETSILGLLMASALPLLGLGLGLATHTSERLSLSNVKGRRGMPVRYAAFPMLLALLAGVASSLFYPPGSYLGDTIPQFFGIELMPSLLFGAVLFYTMQSRLGTTAYVAALGYLSCVLAWVICLPIAQGNWFTYPAVSGAAPFSLLLAMMLSVLFRRFADPGFWLASVLIGIGAGVMWDHGVAQFIVRTSNGKLAVFLTAFSLFVPWMVAWTYAFLRYGHEPATWGDPRPGSRSKAQAA